MSVSFHSLNTNTTILRGEKRKTAFWIKKIIQLHHRKTGDVSVILTNKKDLLVLNKKFLQHNYHTDIITFNYNEGSFVSGDLFISIDKVNENATEFNVPVKNELMRVIIHGILHLIGFNDTTKKEKKVIRKKEDEALKILMH